AYFLVSGGQSGRTSIGLPSLCTVGAAEPACPPADGRMALFSIAVESGVLSALPVGGADDAVLQLVSGLSLLGGWIPGALFASDDVTTTTPARAVTMYGTRMLTSAGSERNFFVNVP